MKQPKSFEEGMERLQSLLGQLQDESTPPVAAVCVGGVSTGCSGSGLSPQALSSASASTHASRSENTFFIRLPPMRPRV